MSTTVNTGFTALHASDETTSGIPYWLRFCIIVAVSLVLWFGLWQLSEALLNLLPA